MKKLMSIVGVGVLMAMGAYTLYQESVIEEFALFFNDSVRNIARTNVNYYQAILEQPDLNERSKLNAAKGLQLNIILVRSAVHAKIVEGEPEHQVYKDLRVSKADLDHSFDTASRIIEALSSIEEVSETP